MKRLPLSVIRFNVRNALAPYVGKIVQITLYEGSKKWVTNDFVVVKLNNTYVWLDLTKWDHNKRKLEPAGSPFKVDLEKVQVITHGNDIIFPRKMK